ncbi:tRNA uridine-5-carboxymethylaminomethyl(34) synthesis GTPase MnmE [Nitrospira sp. Kam-Ns4a]
MGGPMEDTICAVATPVGEGGIGIVRVSGPKAVEVAAGLVRLRCGQPLGSVRSHRLYAADLLDVSGPAGPAAAAARASEAHRLDEALVVVMRAPHSYTAEDVVELHCHGGAFVLQRVCECLVRLGARLAEPGEFTKRAFLNGRLDLTQAEAVLDTIQAKTAASLRLAQEQLRGALSRTVEGFRETLIHLLAHVEAAIDFAEEGLTFIQPEALAAGLRETRTAVARLAQTGEEGRILREGIVAAIVGRPNVGKSSLMNALLRTDRAIVTPIAGTTRDVLEETLNIRGLPVRLLDTAGVCEAADPVEQEGVRRSRAAMEQANLLLVVVDGSAPLRDEDRALLEVPPDKKRLVVINKADLPPRLTPADLAAYERAEPPSAVVHVSAKTGAGLDDLRDRLRTLMLRADFEPGDAAVVTRLRHRTALEKARDALERAETSVTERLSGEFVAVDLRAAIEALGEITGATTTEDVLDRIFQEFCIGK